MARQGFFKVDSVWKREGASLTQKVHATIHRTEVANLSGTVKAPTPICCF